jgi:hypothetical protein
MQQDNSTLNSGRKPGSTARVHNRSKTIMNQTRYGEAVAYAVKAHAGQTRKGTPHPMSPPSPSRRW